MIVADDVALRHTVEAGHRRGIAGTVLVHKIAGAVAAGSTPLAEVARAARDAAADVGTMGVALAACTLPAVGKPGFVLDADAIEIGLGIHGEPGVEKARIAPADVLVARLVATIVEDRGFGEGTRVALLVNGLGATPPMELAIVTRAALAACRALGLAVERAWCGTFLSSLDMPGCSVSLMKLDDARLAWLDAQSDAPAWPGSGRLNAAPVAASASVPPAEPVEASAPSAGGARMKAAATAAADALLAREAELTDLDARAGDGDLGASLSRGAKAVTGLPESAWATPAGGLTAMADAMRRAIGGSSGPFYATALLRAARHMADIAAPTPADWAAAFRLAVEKIGDLGGAKPGDRTMLDALHPAAEAFAAALAADEPVPEAWSACVAAARAGAEATAGMHPRVGRAAYLGARAGGIPDGGAVAVVCWLEAIGPSLG